MSASPQFIKRKPKKYVSIRVKVNREEIGNLVPEIYAELSAWISESGFAISGPAIIRYFSIDYHTGEVDIDAGFPISVNKVPAHARIKMNEIPGGTYATLNHPGAYEYLVDTTATLLTWGKQNNIQWQVQQENDVTQWQGRFEHYLVGPTDTQNTEEWRTEIAILVKE